MDINEIQEKVNAFLVDELEIDENEEFGFKMQREDFKELKTYGEFCQFIAGKVA